MKQQPDLQRAAAKVEPLRARFGAFELDEADARLLHDGKAVPVAPTPFAVLCALVRRRGSLMTKHQLLDEVWGHQFVSDSVLKTAISELRTVLDDDPRQPRFIETASRRGYRFIASLVTPAPAPAASPMNADQALPAAAADLVGRASALALLRRAWAGACGGRRAIVWIAGEAGIGKTALIEHFVGSLGAVVCVRGQCVEHYGGGEPYLPVLEALAELCRSDVNLPALLRDVAPTWLLQLPWLSSAEERERLRRELEGSSPHRMVREMGELLDRYTANRPLLLVTEDLHWSDRATVHLIDSIARRRGHACLMWLASFRLADVIALDHPLNALRRELRLHGLCEEIVLDPFSEAEVAACVAQWSPALAANEAFVRAVHRRTDGVPLFVASVVREFTAQVGDQDADAADPAQVVANVVPENLEAIIDYYIARLAGPQRDLLAAAAVCGRDFRVATLAAVLGQDAESLAQACADLARERLWIVPRHTEQGESGSEPSYAFSHSLFRHVLYVRLAPTARSRLHRAIGAALLQERSAGVAVTAAELAMHFEHGDEPIAALRAYAEAAQGALAHFSPSECMDLAARGLAMLERAPGGAERRVLELSLATLRGVSAMQVLGVGDEAKRTLQRAYALLDEAPHHPLGGLLLHDFGFLLCLRADYAEALAVARRADALSAASNDMAMVLASSAAQATVHMLQGRPVEARALIERTLIGVEPLDAEPDQAFSALPVVRLLGLLGMQLLHLGLVEQARVRLRQAHACARTSAQAMARMVALWFDSMLELRLGNAERVAALADEMSALVDHFMLAQGRTAARWFRAWADVRNGQALDGCRRIREACDENINLGMIAGASETLGYAAEALVQAGAWDAAQEQLDQALAMVDAHDERVYLPQLHLIAAAIARARGQPARALEAARRAVAEARAQQAAWLELLALEDLYADEGATAQERRALRDLVARLDEIADTPAGIRANTLLARQPGA